MGAVSRYETVDHDTGATITVTGATLPELFENAAYAVFDLTFELADVAPTYSCPLAAPGDGRSELLVNWLNQLLAESERSGIAFCLFMVDRLEDGGVQGSASGMPITTTVRRRSRVVEATAAAPPLFGDDEWTVSFQVTTGRQLRAV